MRTLGIAFGGISAEHEDNILPGFSGHDAAAALIVDGSVVAAVEEERLSRLKHSNFFPARAAAFCLAHAGLTSRDIDAVAVSFSREFADGYARRMTLEDARATEHDGAAWVAGLFRRHLGWEIAAKLRFCAHHEAHAWSALRCAPFDEALILVLDGIGEDGNGGSASGLVADGRTDGLQVRRTFTVEQSLGFFYQRMIGVVGFGVFEEYKVMALAADGDAAVYWDLFASMFELLPDGDYRFLTPAKQFDRLFEAGLIGRARRRDTPVEPWCADFAAGLQRALETVVLHVLTFERARSGCAALCFAGGVALNAVLNGRILGSGLFAEARFCPASHDGGNALGAAFAAEHNAGADGYGVELRSLAWGPSLTVGERLSERLDAWGELVTATPIQGVSEVAELLARGEVLGWVHGRSEFGPRALGYRSILADPRDAALRDRINLALKGREPFRPLAPVVPAEGAADWFELPATRTNLAYMNVVVEVRRDRREALAGVTHVNGSARLQTVARADNPRLCDLLEAFGELTGVPVLINTSFNRAGEPLVDSVDDAVDAFLGMGLDRLVLGDRLVVRAGSIDRALASLILRLPPYKKVVRRAMSTSADGFRHAIESTASRYFDDPSVDVSRAAFELLVHCDGGTTVGELHTRWGGDERQWAGLVGELLNLWRLRAIVLRPPNATNGAVN